jgi:hypothetical protein
MRTMIMRSNDYEMAVNQIEICRDCMDDGTGAFLVDRRAATDLICFLLSS